MKFEIFTLILFFSIQAKKDRKLMFTPYLNDFEQYGAQPVDSKDDYSQKSMAATEVGGSKELFSAVVPGGFSGSMYNPGQYQTPLTHLGITSQYPMSTNTPNPYGLQQPAQTQSQLQGVPQFNSSGQMIQNQENQEGVFPLVQGTNMNIPTMRVQEKCDSVKRQAVEIANSVLNEQYDKLFKFLTNYLQSSQYIVGMTQVKMTRKLRKHLFKIMEQFGSLNQSNIQFTDKLNQGMSEADVARVMKSMDFNVDLDIQKPKVDDLIPKI